MCKARHKTIIIIIIVWMAWPPHQIQNKIPYCAASNLSVYRVLGSLESFSVVQSLFVEEFTWCSLPLPSAKYWNFLPYTRFISTIAFVIKIYWYCILCACVFSSSFVIARRWSFFFCAHSYLDTFSHWMQRRIVTNIESNQNKYA